MFAFYATVRQPCSYYVTYSKLSRFYTTFQMDHYDAGSDRDDRPPPGGSAGGRGLDALPRLTVQLL